ncbi:MAG: PSD1 and planctomycete cytochrome C domain-containing protein, partial [Pirellulaceae bacterium]|nr:PSD1 and planctomycete cytochrome C domain-containing protein [Pirellulaceae bacterium]
MPKLILITTAIFSGVTTLPADDPLTFEKDIRPIFRQHCFDCHGATTEKKSGLDLRLVRFLVQGGESGPAITKGNAETSLLLQRVRRGEMPPGDHRVPTTQVQTLERWIIAGAITGRPEPENISPGLGVTQEERDFWAFQPIERPTVPTVNATTRVRTPIDAFLLAELESEQLTFAADTDKVRLLRRAHLDLLGLPPSPQAVNKFLSDNSPQAWEHVINQLLESPHYGERWGRHWLDVAGYADSEGYSNNDDVRSWAFKYRDWVIRAFNADMPFDQFITWQLAGDELTERPYKNLAADKIDQLIATGFLRMAVDGTAGANEEVARNQVMADTLKIVSSAFLGLSVGCAQCHDHRYDPISHNDYHRLRAIFEPALDYKNWIVPPGRRISLYTDVDIEKSKEVEAEAQVKATERNAKQVEFMEAALQAELAKCDESLRAPLEVAYKTSADKRDDKQKMILATHPNIANLNPGVLYQYNEGNSNILKEMDAAIAAIRAKKPVEEFVRALTEQPGNLPATYLFYRGDHRQPQHVVKPGGLTVTAPAETPTTIPENDPSIPSSGRRLAYARWLTNRKHPLVGRVLVNRFWLHHFGQTFVASADEFGHLGVLPTHPQLLDWLAVEFMENNWSLKHLHRLIMTSTVYQQQSLRTPQADRIDGANNLYSHFPVQRLDAEALRDSMLQISGRLNSDPFGAPVAVSVDDAGQIIVAGDEQRRSVYLQVRRTQPVALLKSFDAPVMEVNCAVRQSSTVATQSLMLMNSNFSLSTARAFARR